MMDHLAKALAILVVLGFDTAIAEPGRPRS
jgi:hypothetical protein